MEWMSELVSTLVNGGPVMIPIALASVVGLAVFLERIVALARSNVVPAGLAEQVRALVVAGDIDGALTQCESSNSALGRLLMVTLQMGGQPRERVKERMEDLGRREGATLERYIPVVGVVASISPLLGLLGTVGGMIATFGAIQDQGLGDVDKLAGGISQALVTTFAGLTVGIPALIANRFLLGRVDALLLELEEAATMVMDVTTERADS